MKIKYDSTQVLVMLKVMYSRWIGLLDTFFDEFLFPSEWIFLQYEALCMTIEGLLDIPGISFLEDFKKKYRRPLESLRAIPEEYDEVWNGVSRPKAVNLLGSLDRPWIEAGGPKCEIPEIIEFIAEFDKNILLYEEQKKQYKDNLFKEIEEKFLPPPGVKLEPMESFEKILKPPEVSQSGGVELGDTKIKIPKLSGRFKGGKLKVFKFTYGMQFWSHEGGIAMIAKALWKERRIEDVNGKTIGRPGKSLSYLELAHHAGHLTEKELENAPAKKVGNYKKADIYVWGCKTDIENKFKEKIKTENIRLRDEEGVSIKENYIPIRIERKSNRYIFILTKS